jgi:metal-responsive CopG/Arc/MetJ family transcriptional regulator
MPGMKKPAKRPVGRPPKPPGDKFVDVGLKLHPAMLEQIDALSRPEEGVDRSAVIRRLIVAGLAAERRRR